MVDLITADELVPEPHELVLRHGAPDTITGWQALADGLLTDQPCVFHRNIEISSRYAWIYKLLPGYFKWAGMAAFASYHVRLALFPFRLDTDRTGYVDIPHNLGRRRLLLTSDVETIRATNNGIFNDIFWVHLAYGTAEDGIGLLRVLLGPDPHYAPVLSGFEAIDQGRRLLEDGNASAGVRRAAEDLIWAGNVQLLEHEQRALVQPNFDHLSCPFARLFSIGSALSFEVRGVRHELSYFTSFYLSCSDGDRSRGRGSPDSTTAGAGSKRASFPASEGSRPTCTWSRRACVASSTRPATTPRTRASYRKHHTRRSPGSGRPNARQGRMSRRQPLWQSESHRGRYLAARTRLNEQEYDARRRSIRAGLERRGGNADPCHDSTFRQPLEQIHALMPGSLDGRYWGRTSDPQLVEPERYSAALWLKTRMATRILAESGPPSRR